MAHCPILSGRNERLGSRAGPSCASTVFLLALKTFSAARTQTAPGAGGVGVNFFPLWSPATSVEYGTVATSEGRFLSVSLPLFSQAYLQKTSQR